MQSIGSLFVLLEFEDIMSGQGYSFGGDKNAMYHTYGDYSGNVQSGDHENALYHDRSFDPQRSYPGWNSRDSNSFDTYSTTLTYPPFPPVNGPYMSSVPENTPAWAWGAVGSCQPQYGGSYASTSSPTSASTTYSFEDASPSPASINEFSNVYDFDFSPPMHNDYHTINHQRSSVGPSISRKRSPRPMQSSPHSTNRHQSREESPTNSDSDPKRRFPCLMLGCTRRFTSQYTLKVHMEAHKPKPRVSFECTFGCSERFSRQHDRLRHEVAKHGKVCEFLCDECGRFFSSSKTLGNHKCPVAQGATRWVNNSS